MLAEILDAHGAYQQGHEEPIPEEVSAHRLTATGAWAAAKLQQLRDATWRGLRGDGRYFIVPATGLLVVPSSVTGCKRTRYGLCSGPGTRTVPLPLLRTTRNWVATNRKDGLSSLPLPTHISRRCGRQRGERGRRANLNRTVTRFPTRLAETMSTGGGNDLWQSRVGGSRRIRFMRRSRASARRTAARVRNDGSNPCSRTGGAGGNAARCRASLLGIVSNV